MSQERSFRIDPRWEETITELDSRMKNGCISVTKLLETYEEPKTFNGLIYDDTRGSLFEDEVDGCSYYLFPMVVFKDKDTEHAETIKDLGMEAMDIKSLIEEETGNTLDDDTKVVVLAEQLLPFPFSVFGQVMMCSECGGIEASVTIIDEEADALVNATLTENDEPSPISVMIKTVLV